MFEILGWFGAFCFAICAIPQAIKSYKEGNSDGLAHLLLWLWFTGEVCTIIYSFHIQALPVLFNCTFNFMSLLVIIYYKYFPRKS